PAAHLDDAVDQATGQRVDLVGGHMDAGDRGKYPINVATTSSTLLAAAQLFPDQIETLGESLEIPESDNGAPDFLDELVYELDYLRKAVMNTSKEGALPRFLRP
ncbi:glycoside hydrolase family 9 protein, partial [Paenibacillus sepulcri]|nr:glycoside hydrolase family 9 protein [Paenibacillus sepulcri]